MGFSVEGDSLMKSARHNQKWWFIALLVINTLGLLEILYIFVFSKLGQRPMQNLKFKLSSWSADFSWPLPIWLVWLPFYCLWQYLIIIEVSNLSNVCIKLFYVMVKVFGIKQIFKVGLMWVYEFGRQQARGCQIKRK